MYWKSVGDRDGVGLADELVEAAEDQHAGQRHDERRDADIGGPETLPGADQGPEDQARAGRRRTRGCPSRG